MGASSLRVQGAVCCDMYRWRSSSRPIGMHKIHHVPGRSYRQRKECTHICGAKGFGTKRSEVKGEKLQSETPSTIEEPPLERTNNTSEQRPSPNEISSFPVETGENNEMMADSSGKLQESDNMSGNVEDVLRNRRRRRRRVPLSTSLSRAFWLGET